MAIMTPATPDVDVVPVRQRSKSRAADRRAAAGIINAVVLSLVFWGGAALIIIKVWF
jgi:hypothetical protein